MFAAISVIVEAKGIEPLSINFIHMLSTCLSWFDFSYTELASGRQSVSYLIFFLFPAIRIAERQSRYYLIPSFNPVCLVIRAWEDIPRFYIFRNWSWPYWISDQAARR